MAEDVETRLENLERFQQQIEERFKAAFPNGDHVGHQRYHQLMIDDIEARKRLRMAVLEKTISALLWSGLAVIGLALWNYVATLIKGKV